MALGHDDADAAFYTDWAWRGGVLAGLVATLATGVVILFLNPATLRDTIAGLYGLQGNAVVGWVAHLVHGALFGALFALVLSDPGFYRLTDWRWKTVLAGVVYAMVLAVFGAGVILPMWLALVGFPAPPTVPFVTVPLLLWHLVYGVVLGLVFPSVEGV